MLKTLLILITSFQSHAFATNIVEELVSDKYSKAEELGWWSAWSPWTTCSRSCDGGITLSLRTCSSPSKNKRSRCIGEPIRRRICNTKACFEPTDFRASQCSAYDAIPYRGRLYQWLPFYDPDDPCTLTCQAKGFDFVAKLSTKVQDGTRCREGALDMCVQGQCKTVGCDLEVGSTRKVDECGVCGGDGSGCVRAPVFVWSHALFEPCPVSCGGGIQVSEAICLQKETQKQVDNRLCDLSLRPRSKTNPCNIFACPVVWLAGDWSPCSTTCGAGVQTRGLQCVQGSANGTQLHVNKEFCPHHKPQVEKSCIIQECPRWFQGVWSTCSVSCGSGMQMRAVVCRDDKGHYSEDCDNTLKPETERMCGDQMSCPETPATTEPPPCVSESSSDDPLELFPERELSTEPIPLPTPGLLFSSSTTEKEEKEKEEEEEEEEDHEEEEGEEEEELEPELMMGYFHAGPWGPCTVTCGIGKRRRLVQCQVIIGLETTILPDSRCTGLRPAGVDPCTVACDTTSTTSTSTTTIASTVIPKEEEHEKIEEEEEVVEEEVVEGEDVEGEDIEEEKVEAPVDGEDLEEVEEVEEVEERKEDATTTQLSVAPKQAFVWKTPEGELYSPCAIVCQKGSGMESELLSRVVCSVRPAEDLETQTARSSGPCEKPTEPPTPKAGCETNECTSIAPWPKQPKWKVSDYSDCSVSCGGGWRTRSVRCVWNSQRDESEELPLQSCMGPQPMMRDQCNIVDCPPQWKAETWSKCSKSCGGGFQTRKLRCEMMVVHPPATILQLPPSRCTKARPKASKPCNRKPCLKTRVGDIMAMASTTTTSSTDLNGKVVRHYSSRRVVTKASGQISVLKGSTLRLVCPSEHVNQSAVFWFKGRRRISTPLDVRRKNARRITVLPQGSLRIGKVNFGDIATYTCLMGHFRSDLQLTVRHLPPGGYSSHIENISNEVMPFIGETNSTSAITDSSSFSNTTITTTHTTASSATSESPKEVEESRPRIRHFLVNPGHDPVAKNELTHLPSDGQRPQYPQFSWRTGPWSHCSQTCSSDGIQIRTAECVARLKDASSPENNSRLEEESSVANSLCIERKIPLPPTTRPCILDPCPEWVVGPWSTCSANNCVSWNTAYQKREIKCKGNWQSCNDKERPRRKRECFQPKCKTIWRTSSWSECTLTCGDNGIRMRRVECVWYGSGLQTNAYSCKDTPQPDSVMSCKGPPCSETAAAECVNQSTYCEVVKRTKLCRMSHFRLQCCASCASEFKTATQQEESMNS